MLREEDAAVSLLCTSFCYPQDVNSQVKSQERQVLLACVVDLSFSLQLFLLCIMQVPTSLSLSRMKYLFSTFYFECLMKLQIAAI